MKLRSSRGRGPTAFSSFTWILTVAWAIRRPQSRRVRRASRHHRAVEDLVPPAPPAQVKSEDEEPPVPVTDMILDFIVRLDADDFDQEVKLPERFATAAVWDFPSRLRLWHPGGQE